jgi:PadR family transcriptional regulator, regulatory protein AphA
VTADKLSPASYVVLGLVSMFGPVTPYGMRRWMNVGVGYFWQFPRARLYSEPERLAQLGLLSEKREAEGRRRLLYEVTDEGRKALLTWLRSPTQELPEFRDVGLLKLYLSAAGAKPEDVIDLARQQAEAHRQRLEIYEEIARRVPPGPELAAPVLTLRHGLMHERVSVEFWTQIASSPPPEVGTDAKLTGDPQDYDVAQTQPAD